MNVYYFSFLFFFFFCFHWNKYRCHNRHICHSRICPRIRCHQCIMAIMVAMKYRDHGLGHVYDNHCRRRRHLICTMIRTIIHVKFDHDSYGHDFCQDLSRRGECFDRPCNRNIATMKRNKNLCRKNHNDWIICFCFCINFKIVSS